MSARKELTVHGLNAVLASLAQRPDQVVRLFFNSEQAPKLGAACKRLAAARKVYRMVEDAELEKISGSSHHGGVVAIMSLPPARVAVAGIVPPVQGDRVVILALDAVANAHNIGAMARTAAFLGVKVMVADTASAAAALTPAAWRVSEGGLEHIAIFETEDLSQWLASVRDRAIIIGTDQNARQSFAAFVQEKSTAGKPVIIVMGNEEHGLSVEVRAVCTRLLAIPGSGAVESLNVVQASAIAMYSLLQ